MAPSWPARISNTASGGRYYGIHGSGQVPYSSCRSGRSGTLEIGSDGRPVHPENRPGRSDGRPGPRHAEVTNSDRQDRAVEGRGTSEIGVEGQQIDIIDG